jgi:hypothetical protein
MGVLVLGVWWILESLGRGLLFLSKVGMASCCLIVVCDRANETLSCCDQVSHIGFSRDWTRIIVDYARIEYRRSKCRAFSSFAALRMHFLRHPAVESRSLMLHDRPYRLLDRVYRSDCKLLVQAVRRYIRHGYTDDHS